ncbi:type II secretion system protein (plasmid) [Pseudomonas fulva]|uniref:Pilus assembly protein n=3 Tax=Pseudomonas TaxID=286 RepID=A0A1X0ZRT3_PSEPU|nr:MULTISPECIES: type II secretion system protein [Pseudomonas]MCT8181478.1 type II secretion system GspH family protein [Pseudomonas sp. HD6421]MCT8162753.1 type II secretion system GspH family protein [Pseudomonas sp. HD6422]MDH1928930.1 type II secretion system GspH family protein [Pseudomonas sp. GD03696]MDM1712538.1 type II secretion system protein [Pseudomonas sp. 165]ORL52076.1 pilus assembly protein [Pseudomonas putida]
MNNRRAQAGFTLIEIVIALAIIAVLAVAVLPPSLERLTEAKIEASLGQARTVLQVCDIARTKVLSTTVDSSGKYTHTYASMPAWSTTATLQSKLTADYNLPADNPLGTKIMVKFDSARCYVAVDLPFLQDNYGGYVTETVGGKTRVIVSTRTKNSAYPAWVVNQKRMLHDEETR